MSTPTPPPDKSPSTANARSEPVAPTRATAPTQPLPPAQIFYEEEAPSAPRMTHEQEEKPTSDLFDELDSLLQRMLALPVNHLGTFDESSSDSSGHEPPDAAPLITVAEVMPASFPETASVPTRTLTGELYFQTAFGSVPSQEAEQATIPEQKETPSDTSAVPSTPKPSPAEETDSSENASSDSNTISPAPEDVSPFTLPDSLLPFKQPWWFRSLLWTNSLFDHCTQPLGTAGAWLRRPGGRSWMGWSGLLLLAVAFGLALHDWIRWTW